MTETTIVKRKLATTFEPTVFKVVKRSGSEATIVDTGTSSTYRRNVAHLKKVSPEFNNTTDASQPPIATSLHAII